MGLLSRFAGPRESFATGKSAPFMKYQPFIRVVASIALLAACSSSSDDATSAGSLQPSAGSGGEVAAAGAAGSSAATGSVSAGTGGSGGSGELGIGGAIPIEPGVGGSVGGVIAPDAGVGADAGSLAGARWVGTWTASPYPVAAADQPPASLTNAVLRQVAHVSLGGNPIRVQFSNLSGNGPVALRSAHVALCRATPAVDSTIDVATDTALTFAGLESVTVAAGTEVWSDPIDFAVPSLGNISITTSFESVPSGLTGHAGSRTTSYVQAGSSDVSAASMASAQRTDHWYYISGIEVMAEAPARAIVAIGDSITDGRGTDTNGNNRWTDILSARLRENAATADVAVMNQGIGATNLVGTSGTAGEARFRRDVLGQSGVRYAIVYHGVNDIGGGASFETLRGVYDRLISAAHDAGVIIYGGTILPFGGNGYYTPANEGVRQQVNAFIKSGAFDGYIDFDAALTDGGEPPRLQTPYATWAQGDGLHPGPPGYQRMGETPDLALFTR
jgi:lysophospholipase L1-like esterase